MNPTSQYSNLGGIGRVTTPYGGRTKYEGFHAGIDLANKKGTPIPSFASGIVTAVKSGFKNGDNGFGNQVAVKDGQGNTHYYSHLHQAMVRPGQRVGRGQVIAKMGDSGSSYSPSGSDSSHLDYRVANAYNKIKNPLTYLMGNKQNG